jgi:cytochrome P450
MAERAVTEFASRSERHIRDPWGSFADLRAEGPIAFSEADGMWIVAGYDAAREVLQNHGSFSNRAYSHGGRPDLLVLGQDPPLHGKYRRPLNPFLSPAAVESLQTKIDGYSKALLNGLVPKGRCDIVLEYGNPYPALIVLEFCGLPTDQWISYAEPNHALHYARPDTPEMEKAVNGMFWIAAEIARVAAERREDPRDDLISSLATTEVDGELIPIQDVAGILMTVVGGGVDTTTSLFANIVHHLDRHAADKQRLLDDPELIPTACEEFLRYYTPAQIVSREVTDEVEVEGQTLCPHERVGVAVASANLDESVFEDAGHVRIDRLPNRHAAFGMGIHRCVGSHLARAMIQTMVTDFLAQMPDYRVLDGAQPYGSPIVLGWVTMPISFTPTELVEGDIPLPGQ